MAGMSYATIGDQGQVLSTASSSAAPTPDQPTA
jgi:hypothetical protein